MTALTITYIIGTDNVGIGADEIELVEGYRAEVEARLIERFPGANVAVVIESGSSKVLVEGVDDEKDMTIETVNEIARWVWDHGKWHDGRAEHDQSV